MNTFYDVQEQFDELLNQVTTLSSSMNIEARKGHTVIAIITRLNDIFQHQRDNYRSY